MKRQIQIIVILAMSSLFWTFPAPGRISMTTAFRYDHGVDSASSKSTGDEMTIPFGIAYNSEKFSLRLETAYSNAYVKTGDDADSAISSMTDILVSGAYTHAFSDRPIALTFDIDINIPTGKERLTPEEAGAEWGQRNDLFEVDNFGEGLNIGVSIGGMYQFKRGVVALQGGYVYSGEFDPTAEQDNDDLDPGDQLLLVGFMDWNFSSQYTLSPFFAYAYFLADKTSGEKHFQQGQQLVIGTNLRVNYEPVGVLVSVQSTLPAKNKVIRDDELETEAEKSNSSDIFALTALTYTFSPALNARLQADMRYYGETDFKDARSALPYSGKRIRYAAGPGFSYQLTTHAAINGLFKVFMMNQDRDAFVKEDLTYKGINANVELSYMF